MSKCIAADCRNEGWAAEPVQGVAFCHTHWDGANRVKVVPRYGGLAGLRQVKVYFLKAGQYIKIGSSMDPISRLRTMRAGTDIAWTPKDLDRASLECTGYVFGTRKLERELHEQLSDSRAVGEWFFSTPEVEARINELLKVSA